MPHDSVEFCVRWQTLSLAEQFGNIGSEISRAIKWKDRDLGIYDRTIDRAFDLIDLTITDPRWKHRLKEITRFRELLGDAMFGGMQYQTSFEALERYSTQFVMMKK